VRAYEPHSPGAPSDAGIDVGTRAGGVFVGMCIDF